MTEALQSPAWPHRPPVGVTVALLASLALGVAVAAAAVRMLDAERRADFPLYLRARFYCLLPRPDKERAFKLADHSRITIAPRVLYQSLKQRVYHGDSIAALFALPLGAWVCASLVLVILGARWDQRYEAGSRAGRLLRGPRIITARQYNRATHGDGLRFELQ